MPGGIKKASFSLTKHAFLCPYCSQAYNLVEPEEIPYMLDLHLFLGRKPSNVFTRGDTEGSCQQGDGVDNGEGGDGEGDGRKRRAIEGYEMSELRPDLVHYGNLPQQVTSRSLRDDAVVVREEGVRPRTLAAGFVWYMNTCGIPVEPLFGFMVMGEAALGHPQKYSPLSVLLALLALL